MCFLITDYSETDISGSEFSMTELYFEMVNHFGKTWDRSLKNLRKTFEKSEKLEDSPENPKKTVKLGKF